MTLAPIDKDLLVALRNGSHLKQNPANVRELLSVDTREADASGRRLQTWGFVKRVPDSTRPGALLVRLTDAGIAEADVVIEQRRKPTWRERLASVSYAEGIWEVIKLGLAAVLGALAQAYFG